VLYFNQKLADVFVEIWKEGIKVKEFLNVKNGILSKGSLGKRNILLLFKIWISE